MSNQAVLKHWRICETSVELGTRRLNWHKSWAAHPTRHAQLFAALFGEVRFELGEAPLVDGYLTPKAPPWARRVSEDFYWAQGLM
eukprot:5862241-Pyramimonas_sp.AAC.1